MDKSELEKLLIQTSNDDSVSRAEITRTLVRTVYDFVKFNRPEGGGLDGRDGIERQGLAKIVDAAENHFYDMLKEKNKNNEPGRR